MAGVSIGGAAPEASVGPLAAGIEVKGVMCKAVGESPGSAGPRGTSDRDSDEDPDEFFDQRLLKPLPAYLQGEYRELAYSISRDIYLKSPQVRWEDIAGLEDAKRLLQEAVVMPIKYPHLFTGILTPWKGLLLYGPPGTGKTLLAKAVATECKTTFFNISASSIISKWRGDSEKLVRVLFDLARHHAPSTIFMDELDALMMSRGGEGEHEASRRMKTELLIQMDGLARGQELVFVLAATNMPWELDMAMLRRLEKRILVALPNRAARLSMLTSLLSDRTVTGVSLEDLARETEGFSGSDITLLAKEAAMRPLRRMMVHLQTKAGEKQPGRMELGPVTQDDLEAALRVSKPSARLHNDKYAQFSREYGHEDSEG